MLDREHSALLSVTAGKAKRDLGWVTSCDCNRGAFYIAKAAFACLITAKTARKGAGAMRIGFAMAGALLLAGCVQSQVLQPASLASDIAQAKADGKFKAQMFLQTVAAVEPVASQICREKQIVRQCDFQIFVDPRLRLPENAYQTLDYSGRPLIGFTLALLSEAQGADEIAFVMGHEAAHHILGHLALQAQQEHSAHIAAQAAASAAAAQGQSRKQIKQAQRSAEQALNDGYAKAFELQADALGAEIAWRAGFDPLRGAGFIDRLPQPLHSGRSSHPDNQTRKALVAKTVRQLRRRG
jgi:Zn-dependent protease with chaperone function